MRLLIAIGLILGISPAEGAQKPGEPFKSYGFIGPNYIITAERGAPHSFVLNFINLSEFVIVVQPQDLIYRASSGNFYIGQVFDQERKDPRGETYRYSASVLLKAKSFTGLTVLGHFRELDQIEELSVRIGSKRFYLQALEPSQFEMLATKVGNLNIESPNTSAALQEADLQTMGTVRVTDGTADWDRDWQGLIRPDGVNPVRVIESMKVEPTEEALKNKTFGKIRLSALINKNGGIEDLKIIRGLGKGLDERATEAIKNSWIFLPATRNGEVLESVIDLELNIAPPDSKEARRSTPPQDPLKAGTTCRHHQD